MKYWFFSLIGFALFLFFFLRWLAPSFIFHPSQYIETTPAALGLAYDDIRLKTNDGETIAGWFVPASDGAGRGKSGLNAMGQRDQDDVEHLAKINKDLLATGDDYLKGGKTVLFFHGNAGNISHRLASIAFFHELGLSVLIIDYRGYGESSGKPSVGGSLEDARAAWRWLVDERKIVPSQIIVFGRSLGGGVAANFVGALSTEEMPGALIMESTFTSLHAVGKRMFPGLPRWVFVKDYTSLQTLKSLDLPLLVVHSPDDEVIPYFMGRELFENYTGPKDFIEIRGSHNGGWIESLPLYEKGVREFLGEK